jgi:hypothetical protein
MGEMIQPFSYITSHYGVPACIGRRVTVYGNPATIVQDCGHYIGINYDSSKPSHVVNAHPVDGVVYIDEVVKPRKPSRSAARYSRFNEYGEGFNDFLSFCRWDAQPERSWNT